MNRKKRTLHFRSVAEVYDQVRGTDRPVVDYLGYFFSKYCPHSPPVLDLATGTARYPIAIAHSFGIPFLCVDENASMLAVGRSKAEQLRVPLTFVKSDCLRLDGILDPYRPFSFVTMFNALHHFSDIPSIAYAIRHQLHPASGRCYFYTRVGDDNVRTIWGHYFPEFVERERHYLGKSSFSLSCLTSALHKGGLIVQECIPFEVYEKHTLDELLRKVRSYHFSTFRAYAPDELEKAIAVFSNRIRCAFPETRNDPTYRITHPSPMTLVVGIPG